VTEQSPPPTLVDVAREAGVSLATASRVLNGSRRTVAASYRDRVEVAAERIGYRANISAQTMARGTSRTAALLVSDIADPFFSSIAAGVAAAAERAGLLVTMAVTGRDPHRELELVRALRGLRPQLMILVGSRSRDEDGREELVRELHGVTAAGGHVVVVGQHELPFTTVRVDDAAGAAALAAALAGLGYRGFAVLGGPDRLGAARERLTGFRDGLVAAGIALDPARVYHGAFTRDGGYEAALRMLRDGLDGLDALFAVNDVMAIGALTALREAGVAVPGRLAVAGFDDILPARDTAPELSTVRIPLEELGRRALELASEPVAGGTLVLPTAVVLRASTVRG
jgi:LacI family transcriptional regulator